MRPRGSITGPLVLILVGFIFLLHTISPNFDIGTLIGRYWPFLLIIWGVVALIEVCIRYSLMRGAIPRNGVSGGAWVVVIVLAVIGSIAYQIEQPEHRNWLRQIGFESGIEEFGEQHRYPIETVSRTTGPIPRVVLEDFRGDAKVTGVEGTTVSVTGEKNISSFDRDDADKANAQSPLEVTTDGNTVTIRCRREGDDNRASINANLEVSVPKGASIEASDSRGSLEIASVNGNVNLDGGNVEDVRIDNVGGDVKLEAHSSKSIHCSNIKGSLQLEGRGTDVELENIAGQVTLQGDYTGSISLNALAKPVRIESMRTELEVKQVNGYIRLDRGTLDAKDLAGPIKLKTHSTDVTLAGFTDSIDLEVERGDIELRPGHTPLGQISVEDHSGNIELALPPAAQFAINAETKNGEIDNQFGDVLRESSSGHGAQLEGEVGHGPDVKMITRRGNINVRKVSSEENGDTKTAELN